MKSNLLALIVNIARLILGATFIFSGFVKAIDPLGTQYKLQDYLGYLGMNGVLPDFVTLGGSVLLSMVEFSIGAFILFAIGRRLISKIALAFMVVMTLITVWIFIADPVKDCGCFGDAVVLSNGETLAKNVVLLVCAALLTWKPLKAVRFLSKSNQWIVFHYTVVFSLVLSAWCLYDLPLFDFRPYHLGANIEKGMEIPDSAEQPVFDTTFILEKDGQRKEFTLDDYPDSTWTFIDSETTVIKEGYVPPIHDFSVTTTDGEDITDRIAMGKGYTFLLIAPLLENADDSNFGDIDQIYEYAQDYGYSFYCLTASGDKAIENWRNITGAEYTFCQTDGTTLKTMIRSNPGLILVKDGTIIGKWSHNDLPNQEELTQPLDKASWTQVNPHDYVWRLVKAVMWFFIPLILLVIADRLWAWSQWIKKKESNIAQTAKLPSTNKNEK